MPGEFASDILQVHAQKMTEFENRRQVELPQVKEQVAQFERVLRDEATLTDAMANAVFKDHDLLRNARIKERTRKKAERGKTVDDADVVDEAALHNLQQQAKEHTNRLRRLKGKSGSKLTADERDAIRAFMATKREWISRVEADEDFLEYVFATRDILERYQAEMQRTQEYLADENKEYAERDVSEKRRRLGPAQEDVKTLPGPPGVTPTLAESVVQSDAFTDLRAIESEYYRAIGEEDPTGLRNEERAAQGSYHFCETCHVEMVVTVSEAIQTCPKCAVCVPWRDSSLRAVPFGDPVSAPRSRGKYDKRTYYETWKKMVRGQLNREIPDEDWNKIYTECINRRLRVVTRKHIRKVLGALKMNHYYKYVHMITNELNDVPLIDFSPEEEHTLDCMFEEAVEMCQRCPREIKQRDNFISYPYFFHQACTIAGFHEYVPAFSLLTGRENLKRHDAIWEWICANKDKLIGGPKWKFYPTA